MWVKVKSSGAPMCAKIFDDVGKNRKNDGFVLYYVVEVSARSPKNLLDNTIEAFYHKSPWKLQLATVLSFLTYLVDFK